MVLPHCPFPARAHLSLLWSSAGWVTRYMCPWLQRRKGLYIFATRSGEKNVATQLPSEAEEKQKPLLNEKSHTFID